MRIGVIIVFKDNSKDISIEAFCKYINTTEDIELCFVDNDSKDDTLNKLMEIKEKSLNKVSVVEIKRHISAEAAKRAGARYMFSSFNLKHIGFVDSNTLKNYGFNINQTLKSLCLRKNEIVAFDIEIKREQQIKLTFFKSIFSIVDYMRSLKINPDIV